MEPSQETCSWFKEPGQQFNLFHNEALLYVPELTDQTKATKVVKFFFCISHFFLLFQVQRMTIDK